MRNHAFMVSDQVTNGTVQLHMMIRGLEFRIEEVEGLYYLYSEAVGG